MIVELEWKECRLCTTKTCPTKNVNTKKTSQAVEARHTYPICTPDSHDGFVQSGSIQPRGKDSLFKIGMTFMLNMAPEKSPGIMFFCIIKKSVLKLDIIVFKV